MQHWAIPSTYSWRHSPHCAEPMKGADTWIRRWWTINENPYDRVDIRTEARIYDGYSGAQRQLRTVKADDGKHWQRITFAISKWIQSTSNFVIIQRCTTMHVPWKATQCWIGCCNRLAMQCVCCTLCTFACMLRDLLPLLFGNEFEFRGDNWLYVAMKLQQFSAIKPLLYASTQLNKCVAHALQWILSMWNRLMDR